MSRILALDYGTKRIGAALSDETKAIATPLPFFASENKNAILALLKEKEVDLILLGNPKNLNGEEEQSSQEVQKFASWLEGASQVNIKFLDERFTTAEAARELRAMGFGASQGREMIDSLAAQRMLLRYLENSEK